MQHRKARGRPAVPARKRKDTFIKVRMSTGEKEVFSSAAERAGLPVATYVRAVVTQRIRSGEGLAL